MDYFANKKHTLGVVVSSNFNTNFSDGKTRTPIISIGNSNPNQVLVAESNSNVKTYNVQTNFNYRFADSLGHTINTDFDFGKYDNQRDNFQPNTYYNGNETGVQNHFINKLILYKQYIVENIYAFNSKYYSFAYTNITI